jgi:hypothetical protein
MISESARGGAAQGGFQAYSGVTRCTRQAVVETGRHTRHQMITKQQKRAKPARMESLGVRLSVRGQLFVSSYSPLFVIAAIRFDGFQLKAVCAVIASMGAVAALLVVIGVTQRKSERVAAVGSIEDRGSDVAGYLAAYLLPFVTVTQPTGADIAGYGVFLTVCAVIYVQSEMVQINPLLYFLGYRSVQFVTLDQPTFAGYGLFKGRPAIGDKVRLRRLVGSTYVGEPFSDLPTAPST